MASPKKPKGFGLTCPLCLAGETDRDETVLNGRSMVVALAAIGAKPRYTEYRGVDHNSWDRAYNNARLIDWMLAQARR